MDCSLRSALARDCFEVTDGWDLACWRANGLRPLATPEYLHRTAISKKEARHRLMKRTRFACMVIQTPFCLFAAEPIPFRAVQSRQ